MIYKKLNITISPYNDDAAQLLIAQLGEWGFDSFVENDSGFEAYASADNFNPACIDNISPIIEEVSFKATIEDVEDEDWNKTWEENYFKPIAIDGKCLVRSPQHAADKAYPLEVIINPQMSFGTGYHETTTMMMRFLLEDDVVGKTVLDMGCGTAILGILARKLGASAVDCIDIDEWCYRNAQENIALNAVDEISVYLGGAEVITSEPKYDLIVANINRNILVHDMANYLHSLRPGGAICFSGFYAEDAPIVVAAALAIRPELPLIEQKQFNEWVAIKLA